MRKAFTLVELLVVIAIISILTIITVSQFQTAKRKANDVARKGDLSALSKALMMYYADLNEFPDELDLTTGGEFKDGSYTYMKVTPKERNASLPPFCYVVDNSTAQKKFALFAQLENTADSECFGHTYTAPCSAKTYCFAFTSPNTSLNADGTFN